MSVSQLLLWNKNYSTLETLLKINHVKTLTYISDMHANLYICITKVKNKNIKRYKHSTAKYYISVIIY
jgi:hypothetical protein